MRGLLVVFILKYLFIIRIISIFIAKKHEYFNFFQQFSDENASWLKFKALRNNITLICDKWICTEH